MTSRVHSTIPIRLDTSRNESDERMEIEEDEKTKHNESGGEYHNLIPNYDAFSSYSEDEDEVDGIVSGVDWLLQHNPTDSYNIPLEIGCMG